MSLRELIDPRGLNVPKAPAGSSKPTVLAETGPADPVALVAPPAPAPTPYPVPAPAPVHDAAFFATVLPYSKASAVSEKLGVAQQALADLERQHRPLALSATLDEDGGARKLAAFEKEMAATRDRIATLKVALESALESDEKELAAMRAAAYTTQLRSISLHLGRRDTAAEKLAEAIAAAADAWRTLLDHSFEARKSCPPGTHWPDFSLCDTGALSRLVAQELHRQSGGRNVRDSSGLRDALPGSWPGPMDRALNPQAIPPLVETVRAASKRTMDQLTGGQRIWPGGPGLPKGFKK